MSKTHVTVANAMEQLVKASENFTTVLEHGSMIVEIYEPKDVDIQQPHEQDELYVIISGSGTFFNDGQRHPFKEGDVLFVKAGLEHRFEEFSENFKTWVIFYGPKGGE